MSATGVVLVWGKTHHVSRRASGPLLNMVIAHLLELVQSSLGFRSPFEVVGESEGFIRRPVFDHATDISRDDGSIPRVVLSCGGQTVSKGNAVST